MAYFRFAGAGRVVPISPRGERRDGVLIGLMVVGFAMGWGLGGSPLPAQPKDPFSIQLPTDLNGLVPSNDPTPELRVTGQIDLNAARTHGMLRVTATLGEGWHAYSVTQKKGGPMRTRFDLESTSDWELAGPFVPDQLPQMKKIPEFKVPVEEHEGVVTWSAPLRLAAGVDPATLVVRGKMQGQVCQTGGGCYPLASLDTSFVAKVSATVAEIPENLLASTAAPMPVASDASAGADTRRTPPLDKMMAAAPAPPVGSLVPAGTKFAEPPADGYRAGAIHVRVQGRVEPAGVKPGETVTLTFTAEPDAGWHIYAYEAKDPKKISKPMLIGVSDPVGWQVGAVKASAEPTEKETGIPIEPTQRYHEALVEWQVPVTIPADAADGEYMLQGMIGYQTCAEDRCDPPVGAYFSAKVQVGTEQPAASVVGFAPGKYGALAKYLEKGGRPDNAAATDANRSVVDAPPAVPPTAAMAGTFDLSKIQVDATTRETTPYIMALALVGGFLLNFMPCVLPVIGLKVMSFVQQAGENRGRVFMLNLWYSLGMLSIFWLLATLASAASLGLTQKSLGWGEQFNYDGFTIPLLCVVFVMGLSFIGVWEIPIPGFVGSGRSGELAQKEGLSGAFFKGIVTTILATPCSGPGLATALTWSANKPPHLVYLVFTCMGVGMALPYLIIGAFPRLVRFLPKPGAWMETFKQLMGFVLMGTVVYMFTMVKAERVVPTVAMIFGLWAACWWIGRTPITAEFGEKFRAWLLAGAVAGAVGFFAFAYKPTREHELAWQPFSLAALDENVRAGRTVMVDFTADWCPTCKVLEGTVLNSAPVHQMVNRNEVVTLVADWSDGNEEIGRTLAALGSKQLPVIAIFPAGDPYRPKKLAGFYTRGDLTAKLRDAGPSQTARLASEAR